MTPVMLRRYLSGLFFQHTYGGFYEKELLADPRTDSSSA
jgi:hypothetical protein